MGSGVGGKNESSIICPLRLLAAAGAEPSRALSHSAEGAVMSELSLFYSPISTHSQSSWYLCNQGRLKYNNSTEWSLLSPFSPLSMFCKPLFLNYFWLKAWILHVVSSLNLLPNTQRKLLLFFVMFPYPSALQNTLTLQRESSHWRVVCVFTGAELVSFLEQRSPNALCTWQPSWMTQSVSQTSKDITTHMLLQKMTQMCF